MVKNSGSQTNLRPARPSWLVRLRSRQFAELCEKTNSLRVTLAGGLAAAAIFSLDTTMASQLMGSNVRLPTRSPAFRSQQPRTAISRPSVGSNMHGSSYSSVGTVFGMPSASSSRTANRRVVTMAAKGEQGASFSPGNVQLCAAGLHLEFSVH